jgi:small-conductance mechanosensitive channel
MESSLINLHQIMLEYVTPDRISLVVRIILILIIGFPFVRLVTKVTHKMLRGRLSPQSEMLIKRFVYYVGILIIAISILNELGFKLSALLGAAGVFGIAIGFASQTSISNIISGIFLISEKPFTIGDTIQIGQTAGIVMSVDLLSIKVKTSDNRFVRIPNENMIKTDIINLTRFDNRCVNIILSVDYNADVPAAKSILEAIADSEPLALKAPAPSVQLEQFTDYGIRITYGVWCKTSEMGALKNALMTKILTSFSQAGINMCVSPSPIMGQPSSKLPS